MRVDKTAQEKNNSIPKNKPKQQKLPWTLTTVGQETRRHILQLNSPHGARSSPCTWSSSLKQNGGTD